MCGRGRACPARRCMADGRMRESLFPGCLLGWVLTHPHIWPRAAHKIAPNGARFSRRVVLLARQHGTVKTVPYKPTVRQRAITASSPLIRPRSGPRPPSPEGGRLLGDTPQFHNQSSRFVMLFRLTPSVDALCKSADVAGGRMPMAPRTMRVLLKLMIKR